MKPNIFFVLIFPFFVGFSIFEGISSYEWVTENLSNNVHTFAGFMDDLYEDYQKKGKMDIHWLNSSKLYTEKYSDKHKRTVFNLTFVKCAAEIAHFRVISQNENPKDAYLNLKVVTFHEVQYAKSEFVGFLHFDQTLGQQIAEKFKNEFFSMENQIPKEAVVFQLLQLAFSFAARVILSMIYAEYVHEQNDIGGWQLKTLLTAFKELSEKRGKNDEHGIFPFKIIQIDEKGGEAVHFWAQKFLKKDENLKEGDSEQMIDYKKNLEKKQQQKYIGNFKFILELSDFTLSQYEITKVLQAIKNRPKKRQKFKATGLIQNENQPEIYKKMENYFAKYLPSKNCAFLNFGRALAKRLKFDHEKFRQLANEDKEKCGKDPHKVYDGMQKAFITDNNTPAQGNQIEMELFNEPLWNYVSVIEIDANEAKAVVEFCEDLQKAIHERIDENICENNDKKSKFGLDKINAQFKTVTTILTKSNALKINHLTEFKHLNSIINLVDDKENLYELEKFFKNYDNIKFFDPKKEPLNEQLLPLLQNISTDYGKASEREISKNGIRLTHFGDDISSFWQILYGTMKNVQKKSMKYNENEQLLIIPLSFIKHLLKRLDKFIESNLTENSKIRDDFDFVLTLQTVTEESTELKAEKRQKPISEGVNVKLFELLFSLAIRLCFLIDEKEKLAKKYLPKFVFALKRCSTETGYTNFELEYKMKIKDENVLINLRNWNLPYFVYKEKEDEFKMEKAEVEENIGKFEELVKLVKPKDEKAMVDNILHNLKQLHQFQEEKRKLKDKKDKGIRKLKDEDDQVKILRAKLLGIS